MVKGLATSVEHIAEIQSAPPVALMRCGITDRGEVLLRHFDSAKHKSSTIGSETISGICARLIERNSKEKEKMKWCWYASKTSLVLLCCLSPIISY
jgi:hypothetical protein